MDGVINVLKPSGMTSHDVINVFRKNLNFTKAGHTGTLDPGAVGVLPVCVGRATKIADYIKEGKKTYRAGIVLGMSTDTLDSYGTIIKRSEVNINEQQLKNAIESFKGAISQVAPMYSAIKKNGKKLYEMARKGECIERTPRKAEIYTLNIIKTSIPYDIIIDIECSKGTYIRSLCNDIGEKLGCGAYMSFLIRTKTGIFRIEDAYTLETLSMLKQNNRLNDAVLPADIVLSAYPEVFLDMDDVNKFTNGRTIDINNSFDGIVRVYSKNGNFIGLGNSFLRDGIGCIKIRKLLR